MAKEKLGPGASSLIALCEANPGMCFDNLTVPPRFVDEMMDALRQNRLPVRLLVCLWANILRHGGEEADSRLLEASRLSVHNYAGLFQHECYNAYAPGLNDCLKECRDLSGASLKAFYEAVLSLHARGIISLTSDLLVNIIAPHAWTTGNGWPAFLTSAIWHGSMLLLNMPVSLRMILALCLT